MLPFALAVGLIHNVFLVHDDIEDGDRFRRDREALRARVGTELALDTSDWMLARAYALVDETPGDDGLRGRLYRAMTDTRVTTADGQAPDLTQRASASLDIDQYLETASMKTGRDFALAWVGAALVAGRSLAECEPLWNAGRRLGASFQVCDDLIDLTLDKGRVEIGCDIREGKPTVLLAYALEAPLARGERERLLHVLALPRDETARDDVEWVARLYRRCGAIERAERLGRRLTTQGLRAFEAAAWLPPGMVADVRRLASVILRRRL